MQQLGDTQQIAGQPSEPPESHSSQEALSTHSLSNEEEEYTLVESPPLERDFTFANGIYTCINLDCHLCDKDRKKGKKRRTFANGTLSKKHQNTYVKPYHCNLCDHRSGAKKEIMKHLATHLPLEDRPRFPCLDPECGEEFLTTFSRTRHFATQHQGAGEGQ